MRETKIKKISFAIMIMFLMAVLAFAIIYNIYSAGTTDRIKKELENFTNSLSIRMETKYLDMMSLYFEEELSNFTIASDFSNLVKEQVRLGITPHYNSLKFSIDYAVKSSIKNTTYGMLFLALFMFISILLFGLTNNNLKNKIIVEEKNPAPSNIKNKSSATYNNNNYASNNKNEPEGDASGIESLINDSMNAELEEMYKNFIKEIENSRDKQALDILKQMFALDKKSCIVLNAAGILYTKIYKRENKQQYFEKADKYFEYALSLYKNDAKISNNRGILYSIKYEFDVIENNGDNEDNYEKSLAMFNEVLFNHSDNEVLNNRGTLYSVKYRTTNDEKIFEKALHDYNELIEIDFNNINALNNRSALYFNKYKNSKDKEFFQKSIEDCNMAFKINPSEAASDNKGSLYIYKY